MIIDSNLAMLIDTTSFFLCFSRPAPVNCWHFYMAKLNSCHALLSPLNPGVLKKTDLTPLLLTSGFLLIPPWGKKRKICCREIKKYKEEKNYHLYCPTSNCCIRNEPNEHSDTDAPRFLLYVILYKSIHKCIYVHCISGLIEYILFLNLFFLLNILLYLYMDIQYMGLYYTSQ